MFVKAHLGYNNHPTNFTGCSPGQPNTPMNPRHVEHVGQFTTLLGNATVSALSALPPEADNQYFLRNQF